MILSAAIIIAGALVLLGARLMSVQSDRLHQSIAQLNATIDNVVVPALQNGGTPPADSDTEALFSDAADAIDAANAKLASATAPAPAPSSEETAQ